MATWPRKQVEFGYPKGCLPGQPGLGRKRKRAPERDPRTGGFKGVADVSSNRTRIRARRRLLSKIQRESRRVNQWKKTR